jgi:hypothetical protein
MMKIIQLFCTLVYNQKCTPIIVGSLMNPGEVPKEYYRAYEIKDQREVELVLLTGQQSIQR